VTLSKRERMIGLTVGTLIGLFALDRLAVSPLRAQREQLLTSINDADLTLVQSNNLIQSKPILDRQLMDNVSKGLTKGQSEAESQLLNSLREWAQEAGLDLATLKPAGAAQPVIKPGGRANEKEKAFLKLACRATGTGNTAQVARFIHRIQTASIPVRITDMTINTKKEETDDLEVSLGISTIFLTPEAVKVLAERTGAPAASRPAAASTSASRPAATGPTTRRETRP
jgi:hypothetical protein